MINVGVSARGNKLAETHEYVTVRKLAELSGRPESTVYYWVRSGKLKSKRSGLFSGSRILIPMSEVERVLADIAGGSKVWDVED